MTDLNIGKQGENVYVPSVIAAEQPGLVAVEDPMRLNTNPGVLLASGKKPASCNGGAVLIGGRLWGIDHVAVETKKDEIIFKGTDKSAIEVEQPKSNVGIMRQEGAVILTDLEREKVVLAALMRIDRGWTRESFLRQKLTVHTIGNLVIGISNMFSRLPDELDIIKKNDTELITRPRS